MDAPLGLSTGAADIFANTGGVMEAALRTAYEIVTGRPLPVDNLHVTAVAGLEGVKEASLTIEGISVVIDSGLERAPEYDPGTGMTRLYTRRISQSSAAQRAGRAGA